MFEIVDVPTQELIISMSPGPAYISSKVCAAETPQHAGGLSW